MPPIRVFVPASLLAEVVAVIADHGYEERVALYVTPAWVDEQRVVDGGGLADAAKVDGVGRPLLNDAADVAGTRHKPNT
jgi:hypothetical protein